MSLFENLISVSFRMSLKSLALLYSPSGPRGEVFALAGVTRRIWNVLPHHLELSGVLKSTQVTQLHSRVVHYKVVAPLK